MNRKPTDDMMSEIKQSSNIDKYIKTNVEFMIDQKIGTYLYNIWEQKKIKKSDLFADAEISEVFGHQILANQRNPSRDTFLSLLIAMKLTLDEIQKSLKETGFARLYPKDKRDAVIIFGISKSKSVREINLLLFDIGEKTL